MERSVKNSLLCVIGALGLASCQAEQSSNEGETQSPPMSISEASQSDPASVDDGEEICGGVAPVYGEYAPFPQPNYKPTSSGEYTYDIDRSVHDFSPKLALWVLRQVQDEMDGFEIQVAPGRISKRKSAWRITASTSILANLEHRLTTVSARYPDGVNVWYTHLYNRASETRHEIRDLFIERDIAEAALMEILVEEVTKLRAKKLEVTPPYDRLRTETIRQLPDEIFGTMDVELVQGQSRGTFSGLKISIRDTPPWNWFPESGYDILIEGGRFQHLLKSSCRDIFQ